MDSPESPPDNQPSPDHAWQPPREPVWVYPVYGHASQDSRLHDDYPPSDAPIGKPPVRERVWLHTLLFVLTVLSAVYIGAEHQLSYMSEFGARQAVVRLWPALLGGAWYALTLLAILGAHEMGHYLACRYYRISATLPYFLPAPFTMIGTFGAFIRIREPIFSKRHLFDVGIAGPIAGFLIAVPALFVGLSLSHITRIPVNFQGVELGEPLLFQLLSRMLWGVVPDGYSLNLHPIGLAAWFGLLATLLNLFPIGQLDGGHISYAVLGRRSRFVTLAMIGVAVALTFVSISWLVWTIVIVGMTFAFGAQHPPTIDEHEPLDAARRWLAVAALVIFALCFTPAPIQPLDLLHR